MVFYGEGDDWTLICFYYNTTQGPLSVSLVQKHKCGRVLLQQQL